MTRKAMAAILLGSLWLSGCASSPHTDLDTSRNGVQATIEQEIQSLLAGERGGLSAQTTDWRDRDVHWVKHGDTALAILREAGAPTSLILDLPRADQRKLGRLQPGDQLMLIQKDGEFTGLAVDNGNGWRTATRGMHTYALRDDATLAAPRYQVVDLPLTDTLEATLRQSGLSPEVLNELHAVLSLAFSDDSLPEHGWLRLRLAQHLQKQTQGSHTLISAALSDSSNDQASFIVRFEGPGHGAAYYDGNGSRLSPSWLATPVRGEYRVTSGFDPARRHPITGRIRPHNGKDFAAATGTPVVAASDGRVAHAGWRGSWGNLIVLHHADGIETRYAHLSRIEGLSPGDRVAQGQVIGRVGTTGMSTGPHLHFEVYAYGRAYDPATFHPTQLASAGGTQLAGSELQGVKAYRQLEEEALALLPTQQPEETLAQLPTHRPQVEVIDGAYSGIGGPDGDDILLPKAK